MGRSPVLEIVAIKAMLGTLKVGKKQKEELGKNAEVSQARMTVGLYSGLEMLVVVLPRLLMVARERVGGLMKN